MEVDVEKQVNPINVPEAAAIPPFSFMALLINRVSYADLIARNLTKIMRFLPFSF